MRPQRLLIGLAFTLAALLGVVLLTSRDPAPVERGPTPPSTESRVLVDRLPPAETRDEPATSPAAPEVLPTIEGEVRGAPDGAALVVLATGADGRVAASAPCDEARHFRLADLAPGERYQLSAVPAGGVGATHPRTAPCSAVSGTRGVVLQYLAQGSLTFLVVDAQSGAALEEFEVRLGTRFLRPMLDGEGRIQRHFPGGRVHWPELFEASAGATFELDIAARGYAEQRLSDLFAPPGGELDLGSVRMERAPRLRVQVLDATTREPVPNALVTLDFDGNSPEEELRFSPSLFDPYSARTDAEGWVLLTSRPGAEARLRIRSPDHAPYERTLALQLAEEQRETLAIPVFTNSAPR